MLRLLLHQQITSLYEAEQHVYGIPAAGVMPSPAWTSMTNERRTNLRSRAISIWKEYLDTDRIIPHAPITIPEYRQMLTHPTGDMIVEEA